MTFIAESSYFIYLGTFLHSPDDMIVFSYKINNP